MLHCFRFSNSHYLTHTHRIIHQEQLTGVGAHYATLPRQAFHSHTSADHPAWHSIVNTENDFHRYYCRRVFCRSTFGRPSGGPRSQLFYDH